MATAVTVRRRRPLTIDVISVLLVVTVGAAAWGLAWAMEYASYDTVAGVFVGIVLGLVSVVVARALARRETDPVVARLLLFAPLLKLAMAVVRFGVTFVVYDGAADAARYHDAGMRLQQLYEQGIFDADLGRAFIGAGFVQVLTGLLYTVTGPTLLGGFFVFSWIGFVGLYLFYRAFCVAVPHGDHRRYAMLVFLLPSLLFWPSSLGKEAWMTLGLGLVAYGSARLLAHLRFGFLVLLLGLVTTAAVRPHVAAMGAIALFAAYLTRRQPGGASITAPLGKLAGLLVLGVVLAVTVTQAQSLLGIDTFNADAIEAARAEVTVRTDQGGSSFATEDTNLDPARFHIALASVLFRPYPWETTNAQSALAAAEGLVLLVLFVVGWRRLLSAVREVLRTPYVVLCGVYVVLFTYGFSSFANFGILVRQRVQVLPFALALVSLPAFRGRVRDARQLLGVPEPA